MRLRAAARNGRAACTARIMTLASDVDYVRGINSWRGGIQMYGDWYHATLNNNYLGTYTFSSLDAFEAGTPILYTRSTGDPTLDFFHARLGAYVQDDIRVKKGLTLSPGVRYSYQTRVDDPVAFEPRVGITWAPWQSGKTTFRASGGIFHGWLDPGIWWQTVRSDSDASARRRHHQPVVPRSRNRRRRPAGEYVPARQLQVQQELSIQRGRRSAVLAARQRQRPVQLLQSGPAAAREESESVDRRSAARSSVTRTSSRPVTDAQLLRHELYVNFNLNLLAPSAASNRTQFDWRRLAANGGYSLHSRAPECDSARSTCRPAARWTPNGAMDLPTIRTGST